MKMFLVFFTLFAGLVSSSAAFADRLESHSEAFILSFKSINETDHQLYLKILNGKHKNKTMWVDFSFSNPIGKIFGQNPIDRISTPVNQLSDALYIHFPFGTEAKEDKESFTPQMEKRLKKYIFGSLDRYVPISNQNVPDIAEDFSVSCPERPRRKNGEFCHQAKAFQLPTILKKILKEEAQKVGEPVALVASIIQHESLFDVFAENIHEKKKCLNDSKKCSPYRWGVGLAQLGKTDAGLYGLDWEKKIKKPRKCKGVNLTNESCLKTLMRKCRKYDGDKLRPINCPRAAIHAAALKIHRMIPDKFPAWVIEKTGQEQQIAEIDLSPVLKRDPIEEIRNKIGLYNRSIKVTNSFVEYYDYHGNFPDSYGAAWAMVRTPKSPSISMGHQMLTKEYINRCYVWELAGLCGDIPDNALISQFQLQFQ